MFKSLMLSVTLLLSLALPSNGQYPRITISGAENPVAIGDLIKLKATLAETPKNFVSIRYNWFRVENDDIINKNFEVSSDTSTIFSGTGDIRKNISFIVIPIIELNDGTKETIVVPSEALKVVVSVGGPNPTPIPTPIPTPTPTPNLPAGDFGFAQKIASRIINEPSFTKEQKIKLTKELYANFKSIKDRVSNPNGAYRNFTQILTDTAKGNSDAFLSIGITSKTIPFRVDMDNMIYKSYTDGKLVHANDIITAWGEILYGLDWVVNNLK